MAIQNQESTHHKRIGNQETAGLRPDQYNVDIQEGTAIPDISANPDLRAEVNEADNQNGASSQTKIENTQSPQELQTAMVDTSEIKVSEDHKALLEELIGGKAHFDNVETHEGNASGLTDALMEKS